MSEQYLTIKTKVGALRGKKEQSVLGDSYYGFQSIPFAKPPVGALRFKSPQPAEPWEGVRDAFIVAPVAPALNVKTKQLEPDSSEDCLFLNVYINEEPQKVTIPKAVMVFIHGGGFNRGTGNKNRNGPDFFMQHNIILVTINYRLGALGFLSVESKVCPGNFGLKDQVLALKWVQENIAYFGGDPNNVTIFGLSAGGASVDYHLLSPMSKGLFHKAIAQSGTAFIKSTCSPNLKNRSFELGRRLGCDTDDEEVLLDYLRKVPYEDIVIKSEGIIEALEGGEKAGEHLFSFPFVPNVEPEPEKAFITKHPSRLVETGQYADVPFITGVNKIEGLMALKHINDVPKWTEDKDFELLVPRKLQLKPGTELSLKVAKMIRDFYFKNGVIDRDNYINVFSDSFFLYGAYQTIEHHVNNANRKSADYMYVFTYDGGRGLSKINYGMTGIEGTTHGDELGYLFTNVLLQTPIDKQSKDYEIIQTLTGLWTEFAKTSSPTDKWYKVQKDKLQYLDIGQQLTMKDDFPVDRMKLWQQIYQIVRDQTNVDV